MAKYVIEESTLTGIADAIRTKEGSSAVIPVLDMKQRILEIETGTDTSAATAEDSDVAAGETYFGADGLLHTGNLARIVAEEIELLAGESHTIQNGIHNGTGVVKAKSLASQTEGTATENSIVTGKSAWVNGVKVNGAIPIGTTFNSTTEIELAAGESQAISKAYYSKGGTIKAKSLASQTVGNATAADMLSGKKAWVNGVEVTGGIACYDTATNDVEWTLTDVPLESGNATMIVNLAAGYYAEGSYNVGTLAMHKPPTSIIPGTEDVSLPGGTWYMNGVTIKGDTNLVESNIKSGVTLFGKTGTCVEQEDLTSEIETQQSLISQIETALATKAAAS